jgi:hypothetical protein
MCVWVSILIALGGALPIAALVWGAVGASRRMRELREQRQRIVDVENEPSETIERLRTEGIPLTTMGDLLRVRQDVEIAILRNALDDLKGPAVLALIGVIAGSVGSVWSLFLSTC